MLYRKVIVPDIGKTRCGFYL